MRSAARRASDFRLGDDLRARRGDVALQLLVRFADDRRRRRSCVFSTIDCAVRGGFAAEAVAHLGGRVPRGVELLFHLRGRFVEARHRLFVELVRGAHFALARLDHLD